VRAGPHSVSGSVVDGVDGVDGACTPTTAAKVDSLSAEA